MKLTSNTSCLFLATLLVIFVLSSCITNSRNMKETAISSTMTLLERTPKPHNRSTPNEEKEPTISPASTIMITNEGTTAQEPAEAYYELMGIEKYAEAFQLLSPPKPHLESSEDFISRAKTLYKSFKLLSVESYPVWSATAYTSDQLKKASMIVENERCKRFIMEVKIEYKEGQMGAEPFGTYDYALTVIKEDDGWKIVQIDTIPDPFMCERYK